MMDDKSRTADTDQTTAWVCCPDCGTQTYSESYMRHLQSLLRHSPYYSAPERKKDLALCEVCKQKRMTTLLLLKGEEEGMSGGSEKGSLTAETTSRRDFLDRLVQTGAISLALAVGGGFIRKLFGSSTVQAEAREERKYHYGMVIDTRRCVGCKSCVVACKTENKTPQGVAYTVVLDGVLGNRPNDKPLFMTKPCFHCDNPPCVDVCPVGATFKRSQDGIVVVDYDRCIGCRYCLTGCPYGARYSDFGEMYPAIAKKTPYAAVPSPEYNQFRVRKQGKSPIGNARKCTFCIHLQDEEGRYNKEEGRWPACAKTCPGHAIVFGDFNDPQSDVSRLLSERQAIRLKEELGTNPNVYYLV